MEPEERKQVISLALSLLKQSLIDSGSSIAISGDTLIFFGTEDYLNSQDINKIPKFGVHIHDLVV